MSGDDVTQWQSFLRSLSSVSAVIITGEYDVITEGGTKAFQITESLSIDGVVGPMTLAKAMTLGFNPMQDDSQDESGPNWPAAPEFGPLQLPDKVRLFGQFAFVPAPTAINPEAIKVTDDWATENIVQVSIPQLTRLGVTEVPFHRLAAKQLQSLWVAWESTGLLPKVLSWDGSWSPRFIRGSRTVLSNHAWGTAFDINAKWNPLGRQPALKGQPGSVRELVEIAYEHGFFWGGRFNSRPDGMHLEVAKLLP